MLRMSLLRSGARQFLNTLIFQLLLHTPCSGAVARAPVSVAEALEALRIVGSACRDLLDPPAPAPHGGGSSADPPGGTADTTAGGTTPERRGSDEAGDGASRGRRCYAPLALCAPRPRGAPRESL